MQNLLIALNAVTPLFLAILTGQLIRRLGVLTEQGIRQANAICFRVFMPCLLFINIYSTDFSSLAIGSTLLFCLAGVAVELLVGVLVASWMEQERQKRCVIAQGMFRTNMIALGLPLAAYLSGGIANGIMSVLVTIFVPMFTILAVVLLEAYRGNRANILKIVQSVLKNPIIIGALLGVFFQLVQFRLPLVIESVVTDFAKAGATLALLLLGASLQFESIRKDSTRLLLCTVFRTVILPAVLVVAAVVCGFRSSELICILILFGGPVATTVYTMTDQMNGDAQFAGELVAITSIFACLTLFIFIFILKQMALI